MSSQRPAERIPDEVAGTPVETVQTGARLPCPHDECSFCYWNLEDRSGKRVPTVEDDHSAHDEPCEHFQTAWTAGSGSSLAATLEAAAADASTLFCVVDEQLPLDDDQRLIAIFARRQTGLGAF